MKKWFIVVLLLLLIALAAIYVFIPRRLHISSIGYASCTPAAAFRFVGDESKWRQWWPGPQPGPAPGHSFVYNGEVYGISKKMYNNLDVSITRGSAVADSRLALLPLPADSLALQWQCDLETGNNPFARVAQYRRALQLKKNMDAILGQLESFLSKKENVYGFNIERTSTTDTLLVATKSILPDYPRTTDVYTLVNILRDYIGSQGAAETNAPIMNVTKLGDQQFQLMVAISTDRVLPGAGQVSFRKMIPGHFMVANIRGGDHAVVEAMQQMHTYFDDYKKTSMAIPFAALITDRTKEPDSSKWLTRIYAPVY